MSAADGIHEAQDKKIGPAAHHAPGAVRLILSSQELDHAGADQGVALQVEELAAVRL